MGLKWLNVPYATYPSLGNHWSFFCCHNSLILYFSQKYHTLQPDIMLSMFTHVSRLCGYFILLYCWVIFYCVSVFVLFHSTADIWIVSTFWLSWIMLPWSLMYEFIYGHRFSYWLYLEMKFLGHIISWCLAFWSIAKKLFSKVASPLYILPSMSEDGNFSISPCYFFFLIVIFLELNCI